MEIGPKKWGIFLPYCADWCARHALKPSAISKHFPVAWTLYSFHPLKNIQCRVYWEPSQGSCVAGFHTFLLGMYGWEQFYAWCGVIAGQFIRGAPASGKCRWASFFSQFRGQLFSRLLLLASSGIRRQFVLLVHGCEQYGLFCLVGVACL